MIKLDELERKGIERDEKIMLIFEYIKQFEEVKQQELEYKNRKRIVFKTPDKKQIIFCQYLFFKYILYLCSGIRKYDMINEGTKVPSFYGKRIISFKEKLITKTIK